MSGTWGNRLKLSIFGESHGEAVGIVVDGLPVQLHVAEPDPFETDDWLTAWYLRMGRAGADVEVYRYAGAGHLYTDPDLPDFDEEAAEATWRVALGFLESLEG